MRKTSLVLALAALAAPAAAQTPVDVPRFQSVSLQGGGDVVVRHGAVHRVTFTATRPELVDIGVERGSLVIRPCRRNCSDQRLRVEVVTPSLDAAAIHGGGNLRIADGFPRRDDLALAVHGGGRLDAGAAEADDVAAAIHGGGVIQTGAPRNLAVAIHGGGKVRHCGEPGSTSVSIHGGGTVDEGCSR